MPSNTRPGPADNIASIETSAPNVNSHAPASGGASRPRIQASPSAEPAAMFAIHSQPLAERHATAPSVTEGIPREQHAARVEEAGAFARQLLQRAQLLLESGALVGQELPLLAPDADLEAVAALVGDAEDAGRRPHAELLPAGDDAPALL